MTPDPHRDQPVLQAGKPLAEAKGAVILLHGRGASAEDILGLGDAFEHPGLAYLAPGAAGHSWYPYSFLAPFEKNEPWLSSALKKIAATVEHVMEVGIPREKIVIAGFSQGACLATEFTARHGVGLGGLIAFTGGLIGPPETKFSYPGSLAQMPAFLGTGDPDPHVPWERVEESAAVLRSLGAGVTLRRYPGLPHTISQNEIDEAKKLIAAVIR
ncbi:MAG TPA: dienelactone hydrolase family protein [Bryobacteraceae bacterium]|jgi:predicted esterase